MEKPIRSLLKSISWRIVATLTTIVLVFSLTGNLLISGSVGLLELVTKTLIYFLHERVWNAIDFGRK
jgi:uncharacterized membrane protein